MILTDSAWLSHARAAQDEISSRFWGEHHGKDKCLVPESDHGGGIHVLAYEKYPDNPYTLVGSGTLAGQRIGEYSL